MALCQLYWLIQEQKEASSNRRDIHWKVLPEGSSPVCWWKWGYLLMLHQVSLAISESSEPLKM